jgi:hypothetical protein
VAITVPILDAPRVSQSALPVPLERADHTAQESGASVVASAATGTAQVLQAAEKAKDEADRLSVREALNKQKAFNDQGLEAIRRAEGRNAAEVASKFYDDADKQAKEMFGSLANDNQRRLFTVEANDELRQLQKIGERHVGDQIKSAEATEYKVAQNSSLDRVARFGDTPGLLESEVVKSEKLARDRVAALGIRDTPENPAATKMVTDEVGKLYLTRAHTLATSPIPRYDEAVALLQQHTSETGQEGAGLLAKIEAERRKYRADDTAKRILESSGKDSLGAWRVQSARAEVDKMPAGPEREEVAKSLERRWEQSENGRHADRANRLEVARDLVIGQSNDPAKRSLDILRSTPQGRSAWLRLDSDQQVGLENMVQADQNAAKGAPLTLDQIQGFMEIAIDVEKNPEKYGPGAERLLLNDQRFQTLPEARRLELAGKVIQANKDSEAARATGVQPVKPLDVALNYALTVGLINESEGTSHEKWSNESRAKALELQDVIARRHSEWKADEKNKGKKFVSPAEVQGWVRDAKRTGEVTGKVWNSKTTEADALKRPVAEQNAKPFIPKLEDAEDKTGRDVLLRQGYRPEVTPAAFTPQRIREAAAAWTQVQSGPSAADRLLIVDRLKNAGRPTDDATVQRAYESWKLGYRTKENQ